MNFKIQVLILASLVAASQASPFFNPIDAVVGAVNTVLTTIGGAVNGATDAVDTKITETAASMNNTAVQAISGTVVNAIEKVGDGVNNTLATAGSDIVDFGSLLKALAAFNASTASIVVNNANVNNVNLVNGLITNLTDILTNTTGTLADALKVVPLVGDLIKAANDLVTKSLEDSVTQITNNLNQSAGLPTTDPAQPANIVEGLLAKAITTAALSQLAGVSGILAATAALQKTLGTIGNFQEAARVAG